MPTKRIIEQGETTIGLSEEYGLFAQTIWDDPANASLKSKRKDMNVLFPGDELVIPDKREKEVSKPPEKKHRFKRKGVPARFRLQVFDQDKPRANQAYRLDVDGKLLKGTTNAEGVLDEYVATDARAGKLIVGPDDFTLDIDFGFLDPIGELSGLQKRLNNLGFDCGEPDGQLNPATVAALKAFQALFGLKQSGEADDATLKKLEQFHDAPSKFPAAGGR